MYPPHADPQHQHRERYCTHRLVRSEGVGARLRRVTLLNLGRHFAMAQEDCAGVVRAGGGTAQWPGVAARRHAALLVECEPQRLAALLLARPGAGSAGPAPLSTVPATEPVLVDSLNLHRPRTVGVESVGPWAMGQVQFIELLTELGLTGPQRAALRDPRAHRRAGIGTGNAALVV